MLSTSIILTNSIRGKVLDEAGNPIHLANIEILNSESGTSTDKNGYFIIKDISKDYFSVKLSHIAYRNKIISITSPDEEITIILKEEAGNINEILIADERISYIKDSPIMTRIISSQDIRSSSYSSVKDILETTIPNIQNVASNHAGISNNNIKIQGLDNRYVLFLIDGARVSGEFAGNLDFNMLNLSNVEKIEIIEGGMSSLYGSSAVGGVINIITNKRKNDSFSGSYSYLNESPMIATHSLSHGISYKDFYYAVDFVQKYTKGYDLTPLISNTATRINKTQEEYTSNSIKHNFGYHFKLGNYKNGLIDITYKKYTNSINQYENHQVHILDDSNPLYPFYYYESQSNNSPTFKDYRYGINFELKNIYSSFKIAYNLEHYKKYSHFFNYEEIDCSQYENDCNNSSNLVEEEFINGQNINENLLAQYNHTYKKHRLTFGFELSNDSYSSFNIYQHKHNDDDLCGIDTDGDGSLELGDCWSQSIFNEEGTKRYKRKSFFLGDQIVVKNNNKINFSIRNTNSNNFGNGLVYALSYINKNLNSDYNFRFNYSKGFRTPSIKELYYNFSAHSPNIIGNANLKPTINNYFSLSANTIKARNNLSLEIFYNKVSDMIGTTYSLNDSENEILQYENYQNVTLKGFNCHYERILSNRNKVKFFYNYTFPKSDNNNALELISRHSMRFYFNKFISEKVQLASNVKYASNKNIYIESEKIKLEEHIMIDLISIINLSDFFKLKVGGKNITNYKDKRRLLEEHNDILTTYDPGRRLFVEVIFNY